MSRIAEAEAHDEFVRANTSLGPVPYVPEVRLYLGDDAFGLWERAELRAGHADLPPPFWAFAWPGGQALARYLLDHPAVVAGRTVLDLGAGSGLVAITAALAGAARVVASEIDPVAVAAIWLNAAANGTVVAVVGDVLDGDGGRADVVLAADIWYERRLAQAALDFMRRASARGAAVLAADVGRAFLPAAHLRELAAYQVPVLADLEDAAVKRAMVLEVIDPPGSAGDDHDVMGISTPTSS
jgi:predicted nicotinamide N-methyase